MSFSVHCEVYPIQSTGEQLKHVQTIYIHLSNLAKANFPSANNPTENGSKCMDLHLFFSIYKESFAPYVALHDNLFK